MSNSKSPQSAPDESATFNAPLQGLRVVDLSHVQAGPICAMMLADMGAEVVKIESLEGDMYREPIAGSFYQNFNRNKRSIVLDLKTEEGKDVALGLVKGADVFIENFIPGAVERLGLGYEVLRALNPALVYGSISGFGQDGPWVNRAAFDPAIQALSGLMDATGEPGRPPVRTRAAMIDYCAGTTMAFAIVAALFRRARTGVGDYLDVALMDVGMYAMSPYMTFYKLRGVTLPRTGSAHPATAPNQGFRVRDGYLYIAATSDRMWRDLCKVLGVPELAQDPRFATRSGRMKNARTLIDAVSPVIEKRDGSELEAQLLAVGIPCGKVRTVAEVFDDPYVVSRGCWSRHAAGLARTCSP
ncbi:CaiB/BaiF CoA transferase family protein [Ottowia pentelensis]|uniref:CaiB/BaiF CoA transferase family protein n=1 Tax=Ottowia pentelensis TaxID=511108 RepID=UPI0036257B29